MRPIRRFATGICLTVALGSPWGGAVAAAVEGGQPILPLAQIHAGQTGYGLSVFRGVAPERFSVEVLGVLRNQSPDTSYILARLRGQSLESTGVIAGMSGSPVYIEGRLAGAVAFSWPFSQEAIAGITPIEEMRELTRASSPEPVRSAAESDVDLRILTASHLDSTRLTDELERLQSAGGDGTASGIEWSGWGFTGASRDLLQRSLGLLAPGGEASASPSGIEPGSAVAGLLVDGDLRLAATGTVTDRLPDGTILAFGHPFLGLGPVRLPMASAEVVTVLSNQATSFKIANIGDVVGAFDLDRQAGLRGQLGMQAPMVPMTVRIRGRRSKTYHLRIAEIPSMTPTLMAISTLASLDATTQVGGSQGLDMEMRLKLEGHPELVLRQSFDGNQAAVQSALYLLAVAGYLDQNPWAKVRFDGVDVELTQYDHPRTATLIGAHASRTLVHPGETIRVGLDLQAWRGERLQRGLDVTIPSGIPSGRYFLLVGDGPSIDGARLAIEKTLPVRFEQALKLLSSLHTRRQLVVLGMFLGQGLSVAGEVLPQLPGSLQSVWATAASGSAVPLQLVVAQRDEKELDVPIAGAVRITLQVKRKLPLGAESAQDEEDDVNDDGAAMTASQRPEGDGDGSAGSSADTEQGGSK
jgi:hypothetical protein